MFRMSGQTLRSRPRRRLLGELGGLESGANSDEYRCCLCLHVKTGTLLFGLWQVWVQLFIVSFLLAVVVNPSLLACVRDGHEAQQEKSTPEPYQPIGGGHRGQLRRQDHALLLLIGLVSLALALLMVAGALKERAKYLMPYFCLQLFDFVVNCLTVVGYFSYLPDVKRWLSQHRWPHDGYARRFLLGLDDATLGFLMLIVCMMYLMLKAYLLGMVWACYKYLLRKEQNRLGGDREAALMTPEFDDADESLGLLGLTEDVVLPPKYEDALKSPANLNAPPPYFPGNARPDASAARPADE